MKRILALICIMALALTALSACGKKAEAPATGEPVDNKQEATEIKEEEPEASEDVQTEDKQEEPSNEAQTDENGSEGEDHPELKGYKRKYIPVLDRAAYILAESDINSGNEEQGEGEIALFESTMYREYSVYGNPLYDFGYAFSDLNSDGYDELLIMYNTFEDETSYDGTTPGRGSLIAAAYSLVNDQPKLIFEGWSRNSYQLRIDRKIANRGSAGAAYAITALYELGADNSLNCLDYYYTHEIDGDYENIGLYHNTNGTDDVDNSELIEGDAFEEFEKQYTSIHAACMDMPIITFANYYDPSMTGPTGEVPGDEYISVSYSNFYEQEHAYEFVTLDESEYSQDLVFTVCDEPVTDFKLLKLNLTSVSDDGNPVFEETVAYETDTYSWDSPTVVATLSFPGDMPSYGYSYVTPTGEERKYTLSLSGFDGSLVTSLYK